MGLALLEDVEILHRRGLWGPASWGALSTRYQAAGTETGSMVVQGTKLVFTFGFFWCVAGTEWRTGNSTFAPSRAESPEAA